MSAGDPTNTVPIFRSTTQALHFAYLIQAYEVSPESIMTKAIRRLMMDCGIWRDEPSTVDFGGLTQLEVRAQCAMIRGAVDHHLSGPEAWSIQARYGVVHVVNENGQRVFFFSRERLVAIMALADWISPTLPAVARESVDLLVARHFSGRTDPRLSFRCLAEKFGGSHMAYVRAFKDVRARVEQMEAAAVDSLTPRFEAHGVVEPRTACARVTAML